MKPPYRKLRGYAFDPSLSLQTDTVGINNITYKIPWESNLQPGPVGEYIEVVDFDPTLNCFYRPVNLNKPYLLAQDGVDPSESNPQFHQQMVYAVIMTTIRNFEKSLGRKIFWSPRITAAQDGTQMWHYVPRLRVYPHGLREANAYYSPQKKAILFGYFEAKPADIRLQMPGALVFTCLSHDVITHETTHAILDGIYSKYTQPTNVDVLAFHEAFSDIVALFQHFTFPDVLKSQIARTRGDLASQNLLGQLAQEFGTSIGNYGALRDAIGFYNRDKGMWEQHKPTGNEYATIFEPHKRGSVLVAAVFDAFLNIYKSRVRDLIRIASSGTGILPEGELHPDLVNRLANEASKTAGHVLTMCIRALDYCPPIDITFGDFLRAVITADVDLVSDDNRDYRIAFIEAFRKRGIYPKGISSLSVDSLQYTVTYKSAIQDQVKVLMDFLRDFKHEVMYKFDREEISRVTQEYIRGNGFEKGLHARIQKFKTSPEFEAITGIVFNPEGASLGIRLNEQGFPSFEVHSLRVAARVGPDGKQNNQIIISILQRARVRVKKLLDEDRKPDADDYDVQPVPYGDPVKDSFILRGGCTLIFDLDTVSLKYAILKPLLDVHAVRSTEIGSRYRINRDLAISTFEFLRGTYATKDRQAAFLLTDHLEFVNEPFSFLHHNH